MSMRRLYYLKTLLQFSKEELLDCGRGKLFGDGNAQLPLPPMLMFDRILEIEDRGGKYQRGSVIAELDIVPDLWFFRVTFKKIL